MEIIKMSYDDDPLAEGLRLLWIWFKLIWNGLMLLYNSRRTILFLICLPIVFLWLTLGVFWGTGAAIDNYYRSFYENM